MEVINFKKSKSKKQLLDSYYNIYKVDYKSNLYDTLTLYTSILKNSPKIDMCKFEKDLGIVEYCLDMDLYYKNDCYYIILVLRDAEKFNINIPIGLEKIFILEFKNELGNKYDRFGGLGTGNLLEKMNLIC